MITWDVVIPATRDPEATLAALAAALANCDVGATTTVVDDSGGGVARNSAALYRAHYVATTGGLGSGAARNIGASVGDAPWLIFLDDDITLDRDALVSLVVALSARRFDAGVGCLRAPDQAPKWLKHTYVTGTMTAATDGLPPGPIDPRAYAAALSFVRRDLFTAAGGFPELTSWGWVDARFGLRIADRGGLVERVDGVTGVHNFIPTWDEWLARRRAAGRALVPELVSSAGLVGTRSWPKRIAGHLPWWALRSARGRWLRRLAAAGAEAKGWREQVTER